MKKLSINLPSAQSSTNSLLSPLSPPPSAVDPPPFHPPRIRRPSILSLPSTTTLHRKDEDGSPTIPYLDGPIQVLPGIWLGSEDNARDWSGLSQRHIKAILNVAKEVTSPFDLASQPLQSVSTPNLTANTSDSQSTYYPPHFPSGRPGIHYLKLQWSHGEKHLVDEGFPIAMAFVDAALARNDGVLIHCQCGISRSATLVIAIVMRAAATRSPLVPPHVWELKGMQAAYSFVKEKSRHVGPNMSLIYQLFDYEKTLQGGNSSPAQSDKSSSISEEEREWSRRRDAFAAEGYGDQDSEQEAKNLDRAMEERIVARLGMVPARRNRCVRKRAGSVASIHTTGSVLSEDLVEADEEAELLGVGGGFDDITEPRRSPSLSSESPGSPSELDAQYPLIPNTSPARPLPVRRHLTSAPSAPPTKFSFKVTRLSLSRPSIKTAPGGAKRRLPLLGVLPPVPPSPVTPVAVHDGEPSRLSLRKQTSRKPAPPALKLRDSPVATAMRTPATMTVTSNVHTSAFPFPSQATPRVATTSSKGRTISFIGVGASVAPTTAYSRVDARGWVGLE
ncbi:phosphatases II [Scleroderma citrinum]